LKNQKAVMPLCRSTNYPVLSDNNMMNKIKGYTVIELLMALAIGVMILGGVMNVFVTSIKTSASTIRASEFNQEVRTLMNVIIRDVKRAGYSKNAVNDLGSGKNTNTFITSDSEINGEPLTIWQDASANAQAVLPTVTNTTGTCLTFAYDQAGTIGDGVLTLKTVDFRGFRLSSDNTVQMRIAGSTQAPSPHCGVGLWQDVTSPDIHVSALTFAWRDYTNNNDPTSTAVPAEIVRDHAVISQRFVHVVLSASHKTEPTLKRTLQADILVRNHLYTPTEN
jgi:prepilin peptidase dependent protein B